MGARQLQPPGRGNALAAAVGHDHLRTLTAAIDTADGPVDEAFPPMSVTVRLEDDIDISRGDVLARPQNRPSLERHLDATLCWMSETHSLRPGAKYTIKHTTRSAKALVQELLESDLVDQINLMVFPVILGTGKKAFEETPERRNLRLIVDHTFVYTGAVRKIAEIIRSPRAMRPCRPRLRASSHTARQPRSTPTAACSRSTSISPN